MPNNNNRISHWLLRATFFIFCCALLAACSDNESNGGAPEITGVRKTKPTASDSLFTKSAQGQMIAIIGHNLQHTLAVYINDQKVYFNPTENTDHSVIVTIPTEEKNFKLTTWDSTLKDEIRIETDHGTAVYGFKVLNPAPSLQRIAGLYPRVSGSQLQLHGMNILDVERVYVTDATPEKIKEQQELAKENKETFVVPGNKTDVTQYSLKQNHYLNNRTKAYETASVMDFTLPGINYDSGSLVVECAAGISWVEFAAMPGKPELKMLSSDFPTKGEQVVLTGRNFIQVESVSYGNITIPVADLYVSESEDSIVFTMGEKPEESRSKLTVKTVGGEVSADFCMYETVVIDFDGKGLDNGWGPSCLFGTADGTQPPFASDGQYANIQVQDNGWNWWGMMVYFRASDDGTPFHLPSYDIIPADTPADEVYFAMECYNNGTMFNNNVHIHYLFQTANSGDGEYVNWNWDTGSYQETVLPDQDGECTLNAWYRTLIPMSKVGIFQGKTYKDIVESGITNIRLMEHNYTGNPLFVDIYFDNLRFIRIEDN